MALKEKIAQDPDNSSLYKELGKAYLDAGKYDDAEQALKKAIGKDPADAQVHKWLALALIRKVEGGYDQRVYANTNFLTNIAFEITNVLDKASALAPEDMDIRLMRAIGGVQMPFFVGKLDQAIEDLNLIIESTPHDSIKAEALYWLGTAYRKKSMTSWIEVVSKYSGTPAAQLVYGELNPGVKRLDLSKYQHPILAVDFVLAFRDELAPQTAVWIEDADGNFIKTIYVSGFSGYAKEKQINLPIWSSSSQFADVDGVTAASIDLGHHVYVWDLKDHSGKKVPSGEYVVKVEVSYWPSMKYQTVSASIALGKKAEQTVVEEGNFIPYLEVQYFPKGKK
jgi:tetratricopeptide (TPR) repeat protein